MTKKIIFISWQPYCSRSDHIARELGGESYKIYYDFFGSRYSTVLFKYLFQSLKTFWILLKNRPAAVFVMSPPVFANIPVFIYAKLYKAKYIIDAHTGALNNPLWKEATSLQKFFFKHAEVVIVTNKALKQKAEEWGGRSIIVPDVPVLVSDYEHMKLEYSKNVVLINSFAKDEPLNNFLQAARHCPDVFFYVTGKISKDGKYDSLDIENVEFTDFLPDKRFYGLIKAADVVAVLTTKDNTMQRGAYEAIYSETPVITSDWDVLRRNFPKGTVFVDNTVEGIVSGIQEAISNLDELQQEAIELKQTKLQNWEKTKAELERIIDS